MIGTTLGTYKLTKKLGEGGMGVVYVGEHQLIGKHVAIKVLHPELSKDREATSRFFTEARAAASLDHPNLAAVFDFGFGADGQAFLVMELLHGEPLADLLRHHPVLDAGSAVWIARQIAMGLSVAHESGIAHRDLKPENVFVNIIAGSDQPTIKVVDFGIAKLAEPGILAGSPERTKTGVLLGTPLYMSPEQCRGGHQVDHRTDVYSLGCIVFTMVCGRVPFEYDEPGELIAAHLHESPPAPRAIVPALPVELETLILRMLSKNPDNRPQTMGEVLIAIDGLPINVAFDPALLAGEPGIRPLHATTPFSHVATRPANAEPAPTPSGTQVLPATGSEAPPPSETQRLPDARPAPAEERRSPSTLSVFNGEASRSAPEKTRVPPDLVRALRGGMAWARAQPVPVQVGAAALLLVALGGTLLWGLRPAKPPSRSAHQRPSQTMASTEVHGGPALAASGPVTAGTPAARLPVATETTAPAIANPPANLERSRARDETVEHAAPDRSAPAARSGKADPRPRRSPTSVRIAIAPVPAGFTARLDGRSVQLPLRLAKDDRVHKLELKAQGKRKITMDIRTDTDHLLRPAWRPEVAP